MPGSRDVGGEVFGCGAERQWENGRSSGRSGKGKGGWMLGDLEAKMEVGIQLRAELDAVDWIEPGAG